MSHNNPEAGPKAGLVIGELFNPHRIPSAQDPKKFFFPTEAVDRHPELRDGPKRLYSRLVNRAGLKGMCFPGIALLARDLGKSERQIRYDMEALVGTGLIERQTRGRAGGRGRTSNIYRFVWTEFLDTIYRQSIAAKSLPAVCAHDARKETIYRQDPDDLAAMNGGFSGNVRSINRQYIAGDVNHSENHSAENHSAEITQQSGGAAAPAHERTIDRDRKSGNAADHDPAPTEANPTTHRGKKNPASERNSTIATTDQMQRIAAALHQIWGPTTAAEVQSIYQLSAADVEGCLRMLEDLCKQGYVAGSQSGPRNFADVKKRIGNCLVGRRVKENAKASSY